MNDHFRPELLFKGEILAEVDEALQMRRACIHLRTPCERDGRAHFLRNGLSHFLFPLFIVLEELLQQLDSRIEARKHERSQCFLRGGHLLLLLLWFVREPHSFIHSRPHTNDVLTCQFLARYIISSSYKSMLVSVSRTAASTSA